MPNEPERAAAEGELPPASVEMELIGLFVSAYLSSASAAQARRFMDCADAVADDMDASVLRLMRPASLAVTVATNRKLAVAWYRRVKPKLMGML